MFNFWDFLITSGHLFLGFFDFTDRCLVICLLPLDDAFRLKPVSLANIWEFSFKKLQMFKVWNLARVSAIKPLGICDFAKTISPAISQFLYIV